jgi:monoterpene epsilon-lactone hydrolase
MFTPVIDLDGLDALEGSVDRSLAPGLAGLVAALARVSPRPDWDFDQIRSGFESAAATLPVPEDVSFTRVDVEGRAGELIEPANPAGRAALYLHGGAYTIGSLSTVRSLAASFARATRSRALVLDYRLAPEHPFPAALDDATAAFGWLAKNCRDDLVYLAGDSAGGGLAIATALSLSAGFGPRAQAVLAMSPWTDLEMAEGRADLVDPQAPSWLLRRSAAAYLGGCPVPPELASPVRADLSRLPPTLVQVGTAEPLLDDALRFSRAAFSVGAPLRLEAWDGQIHVWQAFAPRLRAANAALQTADAWLTVVEDSQANSTNR